MNKVKSVNLVFLATVLMSIGGSFAVSLVSEYTDNYFIVLLLSQIILVFPSLVYLITQRMSLAQAIRFKGIRPANIVLIVIFAYLISPLMNLINALSMLFVKDTITDFMFNIVSQNGFFLSLFMVAFIPCLFEEAVYRGVFYNEYSKVSPVKAIFLSAFLFGIIHGNLNQFSYAFAMGIIFALLIEATDSILSTMIVHFIINGSSVLLMYLYPKLLKFLEALYGPEQFNAKEFLTSIETGIVENLDLGYVIKSYGITALISSILAFAVFRTIARNTGRWEHVKNIFRRKTDAGRDNYSQPEYYTGNYDEYYTQEGDISLTSEYDSIREPVKRKGLLSASLIVAILICTGLLILNEIYPSDNTTEQSAENFFTIIRWFKFK